MVSPSEFLSPERPLDYRAQLSRCMRSAGIPSLRSLATESGVSRQQIERLRRGEAHRLSVDRALKLAQLLQLSLSELLQYFSTEKSEVVQPVSSQLDISIEYRRLEEKLKQARSDLLQEFQSEVLNTLEPLLLQWPTAAYAAQQNPTAPAVRLIPLLRPLETLLQSWQIEPIGEVGQTVDFDPHLHQWSAVTPAPKSGDSVRVSHVGYRQGDRLLYRAKVRSVELHKE
jgi:transcriptional regulator with XRE-family HTH domain